MSSGRIVISKRYVLTVLALSAVFLGFYLIWTLSNGSRPTRASTAQSSTASGAVPAAVAKPTGIPVVMNQQGVPVNLGSLPLTRLVTGTKALDEFAQLHGKGFDLLDGYKAHYGQDQALLWVGQAKDAKGAEGMTEQMAQTIGPDNKMFTNLQALDISGRTLYRANGQGQQHFFYAVNDKIVWLAANSGIASDIIYSLWGAVK